MQLPPLPVILGASFSPPSHFRPGERGIVDRGVGAKPCAPVCLSASPSWPPQGTRDGEGGL